MQRGGRPKVKRGDIFWDNESYAIKQYLKMFADLASATLKQVADWLRRYNKVKNP